MLDFPSSNQKKNPNISFRIQANNNNIRLNERKNRIQIPKIGKIKFKTSKEHKQKIQESKINNITIKHENGIYTGIININTNHTALEHSFEAVGIDIGIRRPLTCSNGLKIEEFDLTREEKNVKYYQREMSKKQPGSKRYCMDQKRYWKALNKKINKKKRPISQNHTPYSKKQSGNSTRNTKHKRMV